MLFEISTGAAGAQHAYLSGLAATRSISKAEQKALGQYMTPPPIAQFMARRAVRTLACSTVRILEPAAGSGVLAVAAVEALLAAKHPPSRIELLLFEIDGRLIPGVRHVCEALQNRCLLHGVELEYVIAQEDFLLSDLARTQAPLVDLVIGNPPYFKLGKQDARVVAHAYAVWGQPNIYGLFMAACARLLKPGGGYCFITPRSWMAGPYFSAVRRHVLAHLRLDGIHAFDSRSAHFSEGEILQETSIVWASKSVADGLVAVSCSHGAADLDAAQVQYVPLSQLVDTGESRVIRLCASDGAAVLPCLADNLATLGLRASTGPVVAFRAASFLRQARCADTAPLLWLQHVTPMALQWPINKKREHVVACAASQWMLLKNQPMVVLRRFSPKEDARRVTAAPYLGQLPGGLVGLENHLNYIVRPGGAMSQSEVYGLAAYLNSRWVDQHFRAVSGHTQVNASDLRQLPLPSIGQLEAMGTRVGFGASLESVDAAVAEVLGLPLGDTRSLNSRYA